MPSSTTTQVHVLRLRRQLPRRTTVTVRLAPPTVLRAVTAVRRQVRATAAVRQAVTLHPALPHGLLRHRRAAAVTQHRRVAAVRAAAVRPRIHRLRGVRAAVTALLLHLHRRHHHLLLHAVRLQVAVRAAEDDN